VERPTVRCVTWPRVALKIGGWRVWASSTGVIVWFSFCIFVSVSAFIVFAGPHGSSINFHPRCWFPCIIVALTPSFVVLVLVLADWASRDMDRTRNMKELRASGIVLRTYSINGDWQG